MKNIIRLTLVPLLLVLFFASCTKEGPAGPAGEAGLVGPAGPAGETGEVTCVQCHEESEDMMIKSKEWEHSGHAMGTTAQSYGSYAGGSCNACHTSQGFQEYIELGTSSSLETPLPANCYTCHKIHETYTEGDWEVRKTDAVELRLGMTHDFGGANNTCVVCHQAQTGRGESPMWADGEFDITGHKGPHYGATSAAMIGVDGSGAYEFEGSMTYANSAHASASCIECHMTTPGNTKFELGGHTNAASTGSWEDDTKVVNINACSKCHGSGEYPLTTNEEATHSIAYIRNKNKAIYDALELALIAKNVLIDDNEGGHSQTTLLVPSTLAQAFYNFEFVYYEHTFGVHNPGYIEALLTNTLEVVDAQDPLDLP